MFKTPPVTKNLIIINVIFFLAKYVFELRGMDLDSMLGLHFFMAPDFRPYQLITYMFMHANVEHIFFNMFSLWMFGRIIEQTWGEKKFIIFYLVCGIGAGFTQEIFVCLLSFSFLPSFILFSASLSVMSHLFFH